MNEWMNENKSMNENNHFIMYGSINSNMVMNEAILIQNIKCTDAAMVKPRYKILFCI